jgi:glycosyltransferase involved in cell wall biosynthesis
MRILFVSAYPPARDGIGDYTARLRSGLVAEGHDTAVITARPAETQPAEVLGVLPRNTRDRTALVREIAAWKPDVVHVQFSVATYGVRVVNVLQLVSALRAIDARIVLTLHEITRDTESLRALGRKLYRRVAQLADHLVVHTGVARDAVTAVDAEAASRVTLVPHLRERPPVASVSTEDLRVRHGLGVAPLLLAFGFVHVDKGLDDLVSAMAMLPDEAADVRLVVAGSVRPRQGPFRIFELRDHAHLRRVRKMIARLDLRERVVFTGYVPAGEILPWFDASRAAVLPYRRIEESGVASLAVAAGARIVATDVGALSEYASDPKWVVPPRRPDRLAEALADVLVRDAASNLMGAAEADTLPAVVRATVGVYEHVRMPSVLPPAHAAV